MKRVLLGIFLSIAALGTQAQDIKAVRKAIDKADWATARQQIDAFLAKSPTPEGYYLKSKIYGAIAANDQLKTSIPDARMQAFEAFKKAMENAEKDKDLALLQVKEQNNFYKPLFDLYTGYYDEAARNFNAGAASQSKADFEQAMNNFKNADLIGSYIASNKWALSPLDTSLVLNIAKAALNAGRTDEAIKQLQRLADAKIKGTSEGSAGYELPYQWLTFYYKDRAAEAKSADSVKIYEGLMNKYAGLGRELFPTDDYFDAVVIDYLRKKGDRAALWARYDEVTKRFPDSLNFHFNYANDAFNYVYNSNAGTKIDNREALLATIGKHLDHAIRIDPNNINTNWLYGQYYYNAGIDLKEKVLAIKSTKPEDVKRKADMNTQANANFNKALPYVEKALSTLEAGARKADRSRYKSVVDLGQRIYSSLGQKDKEKSYQAKYDGADAVFTK